MDINNGPDLRLEQNLTENKESVPDSVKIHVSDHKQIDHGKIDHVQTDHKQTDHGKIDHVQKSQEQNIHDSVKEKLDILRKQKRANEHFIRISEQAKKFKISNLQREIRKKNSKIKNHIVGDFHPTPYTPSDTNLKNNRSQSNSLESDDHVQENVIDEDIPF